MGAFFWVDDRKADRLADPVGTMKRYFAEAGFPRGIEAATSGGLFVYYQKIGTDISSFLDLGGGDFAAALGTLIYQGAVGAPAVRSLLERSRSTSLDHELRACMGHFTLITNQGGQLCIRRDQNSSHEVYHDADVAAVSSSFLAIARSLKRPAVSGHEVLEYVFNGVTFGTGTPVRGVRRLDLGETLRLPGATVEKAVQALCPPPIQGSAADVAEGVFAALVERTRTVAGVFGTNVNQALSGGYDTRLLLALFRHVGVVPRLFVYGGKDSTDVRIATAIAKGEGIPLEHLDKSLPDLADKDQLAEVVKRNFILYDGFNHLGLFEHNAEHEMRLDRHRNGSLNLHGGGGEIFRNFFGLPDRRVSPAQVVSAFFSQFDPSVCREPRDVQRYREAMEGKIADLLGTKERFLSRYQVEALYPHFRCRSWFGRENSINGRYGYSLLPFYESLTTDLALRIPVRHKDFGNFQGRLIRMADARLAGYPSQYGHSFEADAPLRYRAANLIGRARPAFVRRRMYQLKRSLRARPRGARPPVAGMSTLLLADYPYMSRYFRLDRVDDPVQHNRIATLEYLFGQLAAVP
ncbi:hypothetical protein EAH89_24105 [Roseomonas nepalensis]|uniref:Asparagine synthetase domain-containing protein n=1 Tax=Muricoccus nepalensis TaxID=1854500 RepID=A0A502FCN7_9PROT|nr:hypothetical protein [Roseomonas nepalensis]TPG47071.1 hypothetical protein EAH89_24105 [Roseomonas nepalensis]